MPIPKPSKGQSQSDFMAECMHEASKNEDRTNEQNVAICLGAWRDAHGGEKPKSADEVRRIIERWCAILNHKQVDWMDVPDPEDGETREEFVDRCKDELMDQMEDMDDDEAEQHCMIAYDDYQGESGEAAIVHKTHTTEGGGLEFILSDETPDRFGDIISVAGWDTKNFDNNPVALFNHNPDFVIGTWEGVNTTSKTALRGRLKLAREGTSERVNEIRKLVEQGILRAVSVGFKPRKSEPLNPEAKDPFGFGPQRYLKQELVECSLVSIPANPNALSVVKSLKISPETQRMVFGKHATQRRAFDARRSTGKHATSSAKERGHAMSGLSQKIQDTQGEIKTLCAELDELLATMDQNASEADITKSDELNTAIAAKRKYLAILEASEKNLAGTIAGNGNGRSTLPAVVRHNANGNGMDNGLDDNERERRKQFFQATSGSKELKPLDYIVRQGVVTFLSRALNRAPDQICQDYAPYSDEKTRFIVDWNMRTAVNPAMTSVTGWAAELVQTIFADYMALLMPRSLFPRLSALGMAMQFGRAGRISIPTRSATPTISGSFVGEGMPIPVRRGAFTAQILTPKKLAVITTWTKEIDEHSIPAIEGLLRDAIGEDTAIAIDSVLIDANPATTIRPAGLLNGVTPIAATAGGGFNAIVGDLKNVSGALLTATLGNVRNPAWLMNPVDVNSAKFITFPTGAWAFRGEIDGGRLNGWPIIDSTTVPPKTVIALDAADFVTAGAEGPRFEISDQATLHEEDTTPLPIVGGSPGTPASPVRSLWQTDTLALRMIQRLNWAMRRPGMVAEVTNITW